MSGWRKPIETAIRATVIHSPTSYSWFGKPSRRLSATARRALTPQTAHNYLLYRLQSQLYNDFYCQGFPRPTPGNAAGGPLSGMTPFVEALSAANSGCGCWEDGWEVRAIEDARIVVLKESLELHVRPEDCRVPIGGLIAPGMRLSLRLPKEFPGISPGFYMVQGDRPLPRHGTQTLVRFYWNLTAEGAVPFVRNATSLLNQARLPFKLKVLSDPEQFTRCDAGVVYVSKRDYHAVSEILGRVYAEVSGSLRRGIPAFTELLAPGLGLAEDPGQGESFGQHRCGLLAEGMIRAYEQGKTSLSERRQAVADRFAEAGIRLERPFLNPGSTDDYPFEPALPRRPRHSRATATTRRTAPDAEAFLRTAAEIGHRLSQEAVWHHDRCNWLGALPGEDTPTPGPPAVKYGALGPDLYSGTAGVAWFLAALHATTGDAAARRTALGAIRQALSGIDAVAPLNPLGLYTGWAGIALAAARVGALLAEAELLERAVWLLQRAAYENPDAREFDLLSGSAGAIAAWIALQDLLQDASVLDWAIQLADELLQTANRSAAGYSWNSAASPGTRNLTGFSHGTAGVGYALLELFHATGEVRYRRAAEQAFEYERHWFDAEAGNWPDFREQPARGKRRLRPLAFAVSWCHGAPGIALSRLRAYAILNDPACKSEAITALQTTAQMVEAVLQSGTGNYSLCHGLAGNAEVLLHGCRVLGQECAGEAALALAVAQAGIATYAKRGLPWPCGVAGGGETPGLMLGLAGIGYFYLRLYDPAIPSVLILQREQYQNQLQSSVRT